MARDTHGNRLYTSVDIKVILPEGLKPQHQVMPASPRCYFAEKNIEEIVEKAVEYLDKTYPLWEFRFVSRGANAFTFVYEGLRPASTPVVQVEQKMQEAQS